MVVQTRDRHLGHSGAVGLHIGAVNVEQYFPREVELVELQLDHLRIVCPLTASFWDGQPEIHDQRLSLWLESKRNSGKMAARDAPVAMIPCGERSFKLQVMSKDESDRALTGPPAASLFAPVVSPAALIEPRRRDPGHAPERRKVARLNGDDRSSAAAHN